jgi:hypothetical protein
MKVIRKQKTSAELASEDQVHPHRIMKIELRLMNI